MYKKTKFYLWVSFLGLIVLCVIMFILVWRDMSKESNEAITQIGTVYMSEMNRQIQQKFEAVIDLRMIQLNGVRDRNPAEELEDYEEMVYALARSARVREFDFLGLYTADGEFDTIYGREVYPHLKDELLAALNNEGSRVLSGYDLNGNKMLLLVTDAEYPMSGGETSVAMVAGITMSYLEEVLALEEDDSLIYSHLIRRDGTFVIKTKDVDYFASIAEMFTEVDGKTSEEYAKELQEAIEKGEDYSATIRADGEYRHVLCTPLANTEWYLVSVMPFGVLDSTVKELNYRRQYTILAACGVILLGVLAIFVFYYRTSQKQLAALDRLSKEAVRANQAKSEFLSNMSHDIRTPMNGIVGMTAIAMANIEDSARVKDCLAKITSSSKHLLGLINDVLDMSKIESGKLNINLNQVSLSDIMQGIVNIVQPQVKAKKLHFDIFIQDIETEDIYCDSVRLNQVLINLLSNAIKFTPEGGKIRVYLRQEPSPVGDNFVRCHFRVTDTGIGMTPEFQKEIFNKFSREDSRQVERTEGTGLGMAITKCIVDAMNGTIELQSAPGEGSEFRIILDMERAVTREADMVLPPWNMLVVDNNEDMCVSTVASLKEIGINAEWTLEGRTAVQMVQKHHENGSDYEIVLLDWQMPDMNGIETAREIRKYVGEDVPILIISAYDWSDIEEEAKEAGIQGFISKPLFKSNLFLGLSRYMLGEIPETKQKDTAQAFIGKRVLVAEDNELNWEIAEDILTDAGFEVERAENGKVCVEKFEASEVGQYDVILMDIRMPVMTGYDAAKAIRASERADARLPIIAMTADAFSEDIRRCLECGMNEHIAKPINIKVLMAALKRYLG